MIGGKPTIANVSMTSADTEYSYSLPTRAVKVLVKLRGTSASFKLSYTEGASGTTYLTIPAGGSKSIDEIKGTGLTLYFQSPSASQVMELEVWQ